MANDRSLPEAVAANASAAFGSATEAVTGVTESAADFVATAKDGAGVLAERARDASGKIAERLADGKDQLSETTSRLAGTTSRLVERVTETGGLLGDRALGVIAVGFAAGLLAGAIAPVTNLERGWIAPWRDAFLERAQRAVADIVQHGRGVLTETTAAATDSATRHGRALAEDLQNDFAPSQLKLS